MSMILWCVFSFLYLKKMVEDEEKVHGPNVCCAGLCT